MKLFHAPASPFVRKVVVMLHEMGRQDQVTLVPVSGNPLDPGSLPIDLNPLGKIPALLTDHGQTLYDSRVICRFLDAQFQAGLYPQGDRLWDCLTLEATGDGICDAAVLMRYETGVRPESARSPEWLEAQWAKIARAWTRWSGAGSTIWTGRWTWGRSRWPARLAIWISGWHRAPGGPITRTWRPGKRAFPGGPRCRPPCRSAKGRARSATDLRKP